MARYRITATLNYDVDSDLCQDLIIKGEYDELRKQLVNNLLKLQIRAEKIKDRLGNVRLGFFHIEDVLPYICRDESKRIYVIGDKGYAVKMNSQRYFIFRESLSCAACGLIGTIMALEQNPEDKSPHFNLYADENGRLILMTKDHVKPKAYGGEDRHSNFQTMCAICNNLKGRDNLSLDSILKLRDIYNKNYSLPRRKLRILLKEARQQLMLPQNELVVNKIDINEARSELKLSLVLNTDIHICKTNGGLIGRSVYEKEMHGAEIIASIKTGTALEMMGAKDALIVVGLDDKETFLVHQGHLDYVE